MSFQSARPASAMLCGPFHVSVNSSALTVFPDRARGLLVVVKDYLVEELEITCLLHICIYGEDQPQVVVGVPVELLDRGVSDSAFSCQRKNR